MRTPAVIGKIRWVHLLPSRLKMFSSRLRAFAKSLPIYDNAYVYKRTLHATKISIYKPQTKHVGSTLWDILSTNQRHHRFPFLHFYIFLFYNMRLPTQVHKMDTRKYLSVKFKFHSIKARKINDCPINSVEKFRW